jgi:transposase InsO family protein
VKPDTILRWHKQIAEWTWTTERRGKRPLDPELKALIIRIKRENRLWGPKRIHGELLKLGFQVSETTVRNVLRKAKIEPWDGTSSGTWKEFLKRHEDIWAIDFFNVHTAFFQRLFVLAILDVHSRKLIRARVTSRPTTEWVCQVLNWEMTESQAPQAIVHDRDPAFQSHKFKELLEQMVTKNLKCPNALPSPMHLLNE